MKTWDVYAMLPEPDKRSIYDAPGVATWFDRLFQVALFAPHNRKLTGHYLLELKAKDEAAKK